VKCQEVEAGTGKYETSHCETPQGVGGFETIPIAGTTETETKATGQSAWTFETTLIPLEISCAGMQTSSGVLTNIEEGGEMKAHGTNIVFHYTECHAARRNNPELTCEVESGGQKGVLTTSVLTSLTQSEHKVKFLPEGEGTTFISFKILKGGCITTTMEFKVVGALTGVASTEKHSHITFEPATNGNELFAGGGVGVNYSSTHATYMKGTETTVGLETF